MPITAHSSAVNVPPGRYQIAVILEKMLRPAHPPKPKRKRPPLKMTPKAIRNRMNRAEHRKREKAARLSALHLDAATILNPDERCELWNRSP